MSGPNVQPQQSLAGEQKAAGEQYGAAGTDLLKQGVGMAQPLIDQLTKLSSGDPTATLQAAQPLIKPITQGYTASKENIYDTVGPGAGRDVALAQGEMSKNASIASALGGTAMAAPGQLAQLGQAFSGVGLQEQGAGLSALGGASSTNNSVMQAQAAQQQAKMSMWSGLAGAAGQGVGSYYGAKSDARLKKDIVTLGFVTPVLEALAKLRGVYYNWKDPARGEQREIGVIAQDVQEVLPELVAERGGYLAVDYARMTAFLIEVAKAQQAEIEELKKQFKAPAEV